MKLPFFGKKKLFDADFVDRSESTATRLTVVAGLDQKKVVQVYHEMTELPDFRELLTVSRNASFAVKETSHQSVAALCQKSAALLLATEEFRSTNDYLSLKQRLAAQYPVVNEAVASSTVLLSLYSDAGDHGRMTDRQEGDEALSTSIFNSIVEQGIRDKCTDIHIVIMEEGKSAVILFRIDGQVYLTRRVPISHCVAAVGVAFNKLADKGTRSEGAFNRDLDQSAKIPVVVDGNGYTMRWQSIALYGGFKVILRTLETTHSKTAVAKSFAELGYSPDQCRQLDIASRKTKGLTVISGPTGSGKSTTLKAMMTHSPTRHRRIQYSVEDPVEYKLFGVSQKSLQRSVVDNDTRQIVKAMEAILRGDPDELMVGEIRGKEMASLVMGFVQSGHKSMTSVHAASALEIVPRLTSEQIGMPRSIMSGRNFLTALGFQLLIPLLCENCRIPAVKASDELFPPALREALRSRFQVDPDRMFVTNPDGCTCCKHRGTSGQTVIAEVVRPDATLRHLLGQGRDVKAEEYWRKTRIAAFDEGDCTGKTHLEHGVYKACMGLIDPVTLEAETEPFEEYQIYPLQNGAEHA